MREPHQTAQPVLMHQAIGVKFKKITPDYTLAELPLHPELAQISGVFHGGAILTLADTVAGVLLAKWSGYLDAPPNKKGDYPIPLTVQLSANMVGNMVGNTKGKLSRAPGIGQDHPDRRGDGARRGGQAVPGSRDFVSLASKNGGESPPSTP